MRNHLWTLFTAGAVIFSATCVGVSHWNFCNARAEAEALREELAAVKQAQTIAQECKLPPLSPIDPEKTETASRKGITVYVSTLAVRNNNPLNIKTPRGGNKWVGQVGTDKFGHAIFGAPEHGIRAAANVLLSYYPSVEG